MIMNMYSVFDTIAEVFSKPFTAHNDKDAIRAFINSTKEQGDGKNDYVLYHVGAFDDNNGELVHTKVTKIFSGFDIKLNNVEDIKNEVNKDAI